MRFVAACVAGRPKRQRQHRNESLIDACVGFRFCAGADVCAPLRGADEANRLLSLGVLDCLLCGSVANISRVNFLSSVLSRV